MTTAESSGGKRWPRWKTTIATLGHHESKAAVFYSVGNVAFWIPVFWLPRHSPIVGASIYVLVILLGLQLALSTAGNWHRQMLRRLMVCDYCIDDRRLLDPQAQVTKYRPTLRRHHDHRLHRLNYYFAFAYMAAILASLFIHQLHGLGKLALQISCTVLLIAALTEQLFTANIRRIHSWLYPWCPWCHPRRDDDQDVEPDPTPDPGEPVKPPQTVS